MWSGTRRPPTYCSHRAPTFACSFGTWGTARRSSKSLAIQIRFGLSSNTCALSCRSVAFNYEGSKLVTTCKDKKIRVIDPRSGAIVQQGAGHEGMKPQRAIFTRDGRILSTGFTKRSERMYALRDEEALDEPIIQEELDTSNGVLMPFYDADTGLLYLVGKGDCSIRYYEVNDDAPFVHYINTHTAQEPQRGIGFMPKLGLHINENEIDRLYVSPCPLPLQPILQIQIYKSRRRRGIAILRAAQVGALPRRSLPANGRTAAGADG